MTKVVVAGYDSDCIDGTVARLSDCGGIFYDQVFSREDHRMQKLADEGVLIRIGQDPIEFLENQVFYDRGNAKSVGFGILMDQARYPSWSQVWSYIKRHTKILYVDANPIELKTRHTIPKYVGIADCMRACQTREIARKEAETYFANSEIMFTDIADWKSQWGRILEFCGIGYKEPWNFHDESEQRRARNYEDIKDAFRNTSYEKYIV